MGTGFRKRSCASKILIRAQTARQIAQQAEWQREIILAQYFPPIRPSALDGGIVWHVPAIVFVAADDAIAGSVKETVLRQIPDVILQQDETRLPAGNIEPAQHFDFVAFHVDREKVEAFWWRITDRKSVV